MTTQPRALTRSGTKACNTARGAKKLTSNSRRAASRSVSSAGMTKFWPLLFTRTSRRPPVAPRTLATAAAIDSADKTSSVKTVTWGALESWAGSLAGLRRVANTWYPLCAKASAKPAPMPPAEQPVMSTDFREEAMAAFL